MIHEFVPKKSVVHIFVTDVVQMLLVLKLCSHSVNLCKGVDSVSVTVIGFFLKVRDLFEKVHISAIHLSLDLIKFKSES